MIKVFPVKAFKDNYIWILANLNNSRCLIVDPGDAQPVINFLTHQKFTPVAILITHHHHDHSGGIKDLCAEFPEIRVCAPEQEPIEHVDHKVSDNAKLSFPLIGVSFQVMEIPGHTKGHVAYYGEEMLFCGDTLFSAGCGRLFEGTASEMFHSLMRICSLPDNTLIYCAHEYTSANLRFAETVEPNNLDIQKRIIEVEKLEINNIPTLPSVLCIEKLTNPFLRCHVDAIKTSIKNKFNKEISDPISLFATLRSWKDSF